MYPEINRARTACAGHEGMRRDPSDNDQILLSVSATHAHRKPTGAPEHVLRLDRGVVLLQLDIR